MMGISIPQVLESDSCASGTVVLSYHVFQRGCRRRNGNLGIREAVDMRDLYHYKIGDFRRLTFPHW